MKELSTEETTCCSPPTFTGSPMLRRLSTEPEPPTIGNTSLPEDKLNSTSGMDVHDNSRLTSTSPTVDSLSNLTSKDPSPSASASCGIRSDVSPLNTNLK